MQPPSDSIPPQTTWSLQRLLLVAQLGLLGVVVTAFGGLLGWSNYRAVIRNAEADLLGAAQQMAQQLAAGDPDTTLQISDVYVHRFGPAPRDRAYFVLWRADGTFATSSNPRPEAIAAPEQRPPTRGPRPFLTRQKGRNLEVVIDAPGNALLLVGRPLSKEWDGLYRQFAEILLMGLISLIAGAVAAWWLARRLAQPLETMAATAAAIDSNNLRQRLVIPVLPHELGTLAAAFNRTLGGLETAFERQRRFTADASHELRTPVSVVLAQAEHTLARSRSETEYRDALATCLASALRMKKLVDHLLLLARADAHQLTPRREEIDFSEIARQASGLLNTVAAKRQIQIDVSTERARIAGDPDQLEQLIFNLLANAVQHSPAGGTVSVRISSADGFAVLIVEDHGTGIAPEHVPLLFDRFFRADAARERTTGTGTGLGLSICAEIVASHGGTIHAESELGTGTRMTVRLPLLTYPPSP